MKPRTPIHYDNGPACLRRAFHTTTDPSTRERPARAAPFIPDAMLERCHSIARQIKRVVRDACRRREIEIKRNQGRKTQQPPVPTSPNAAALTMKKAATDARWTKRPSPTPRWGGIVVTVLACYNGQDGWPT
jgi:hypothetical protein